MTEVIGDACEIELYIKQQKPKWSEPVQPSREHLIDNVGFLSLVTSPDRVNVLS